MKGKSADHLSILVVVITVALCTIAGFGSMVVLSFVGKPVPDQLDRAFTLLAGALVALIAKTSSGPQPVQVENPPNQPVPVDPKP